MAKKRASKTSAKRPPKRAGEPSAKARSLFGFAPQSWVAQAKLAAPADAKAGKRGFIFYFGRRDAAAFQKVARAHLASWQADLWARSDADSLQASGKNGPVWVFRPPVQREPASHEGRLEKSPYARARDQVGAAAASLPAFELDKIILDFQLCSPDEERGALVGLELGRYSYGEASGQRPARSWAAHPLELGNRSVENVFAHARRRRRTP